MANSSIVVEGGLFPSDFMERIAVGELEGQRASDFGLSRSQRLTNEIQSAFSDAHLYWDSFQRRLARSSVSKTTLTRQDWTEKLTEVLGYETLNRQRIEPLDGTQAYNIYARVGEGDSASPFHVVSIEQPLDSRTSRSRRSPHAVVQEYLNNSDALWGVVTNGSKIRLLRNSTRISHPTYIEFDVQGMIESNQFADFATLYRLIHRTRLPNDAAPPQDCLLEQYFQQGIDEHSRVRDKLRDGVEQALKKLGNAFLTHRASAEIRERLDAGALDSESYYRQLLRLVYRLLFLMVAEERRLLHPDAGADAGLHRIYDRYYSITRVRERAERYFADDRNSDIWESVKQTFRLFRDDNTASKLGFTALDGELFGYSACEDLELSSCSNRNFLEAMLNLSTFMDENSIRRRVNYAGIDVEEFGSVYESLLDFHPRAELAGGRYSFDLVSGTERKETGSYYTPPDLVHELVESALVPVMNERLRKARGIDRKIEALLSLKVCDPAAGSGHFLLAAARRIAHEVAKLRSGEAEPSPADYRAALRDTVRNCIYAVDKNPLAVDLCKVALWIEGHEPGMPLSFLDHRIKCGDSLVGVADLDVLDAGIPDKAYTALDGDDKAVASMLRKRNRDERRGKIQHRLEEARAPYNVLKETAAEYETFSVLQEANASDVRAKSDIYDSMRGGKTDWYTLKIACDLWTAAFFMPKRNSTEFGEESVPTTGTLRRWRHNRAMNGKMTGKVAQMAADMRFFHWSLEFPDVFANDGGFDVILGNPPWEVIQAEERLFFSQQDSHIANLTGQNRKRAIAELPASNPKLADIFDRYRKNIASTANFLRGCRRFSLTARGKINNYAVFAETARYMLAPNGRMGMIVPTGIATDDSTKNFFADIVRQQALVSLFDFENKDGIFAGVHRGQKFCILTIGGEEQRNTAAEFAFFLYRTLQLADDNSRFRMSTADFDLFNPNTSNCPVFRSRHDMEISRRMYNRAGVLWRESKPGHEESNPWGINFTQMFNMTTASHLFRTYEQLKNDNWVLQGNIFTRGDEHYLPLYEAKMFDQYDHRFGTFADMPKETRFKPKVRIPSIPSSEKKDVHSVTIPRYWLSASTVFEKTSELATLNLDRKCQPLNKLVKSFSRVSSNSSISEEHLFEFCQVFRDVTSATNERTLVSGIVPESAIGHTATVATYKSAPAISSALVMANMNSVPFDWTARLSIGGLHMSLFIIKQLPVLPPEAYLEEAMPGACYVELVVPRVLELTYTSHELEGFARDLGYDGPPFVWNEERRHRLRCELDAIYAHMYHLERSDLEWILDAPEPSASFPKLKRNEIAEFGEYRTQRYALAAYDQLARGELPDLKAAFSQETEV